MKPELTKQEQAIRALMDAPCEHMGLTPVHACTVCCTNLVRDYAATAALEQRRRDVAAVEAVEEPGEPTAEHVRQLETMSIQSLACLTNVAVRMTKEEAIDNITRGEPAWCCAGCGSVGPFKNITHETPGEPDDYDMECVACGSLEVCESVREAFERHDELAACAWPNALRKADKEPEAEGGVPDEIGDPRDYGCEGDGHP